MNSNSINLVTFAGGALSEKFDRELTKVLENIKDPNTSGKARSLTIKLTFKPDGDDRQLAKIAISTKSVLAPTTDAETRLIIDVDNEGKVRAAEWGNQMLGQVSIEENQTLELDQDQSSNVIDLQKNKKIGGTN